MKRRSQFQAKMPRKTPYGVKLQQGTQMYGWHGKCSAERYKDFRYEV